MVDKKATLLIKNIHKIYTMKDINETPLIYTHGFIALHHDEIMDIGEHDFSSHIDKDTRILDGMNHIAIPAFIEVKAVMTKEEQQGLREQNEYFMRYMLNGTLCIHVGNSIYEDMFHNYHYEIMQNIIGKKDIEVLPVLSHMKKETHLKGSKFCISCYDVKVSMQNQMMAAQMLAMKDELNAYHLLQALTTMPADYLSRTELGRLEKGMCGNILLLSTKDIHTFFYALDQNKIAQIIHKGVRIYPNLLI